MRFCRPVASFREGTRDRRPTVWGWDRPQPCFNATTPIPEGQSRSRKAIADFGAGGVADDVRVEFDNDRAHARQEIRILGKKFALSSFDVDQEAVEFEAGLALDPFDGRRRHFYRAPSEPDRRTAGDERIAAIKSGHRRVGDDLLTN